MLILLGAAKLTKKRREITSCECFFVCLRKKKRGMAVCEVRFRYIFAVFFFRYTGQGEESKCVCVCVDLFYGVVLVGY